jgi:outer membrane protein OmpA-like peptidoglycan-associated protein/Tol biopolymer transport system component
MFSLLPYRHWEPLVCVLAVLAISPLTAQPVPVVADTSLPTQQLSASVSQYLPATTTGGNGLIAVQGINSSDRDNSPIISADGTIMFFNSTRRGNRPWARFNPAKGRYDDDIYYATRSFMARNEEVWSEPINLGASINSSEDDGIAAISPDGQRVYFTSFRRGWEKDGGPFFEATMRGSEWADVKGMGGGISRFFISRDKTKRFLVYGASVSSDGKDFYFATSVHSPTEKHQIWVSHLQNGEWSDPVNLGPAINKPDGSYAPFIAADGKTLFFSTSHDGSSDDDIFVTMLKDGEWSTPVNVEKPINTDANDAFLSVPASGDRVYLASSREGNDDIFVAPLPANLRPASVALLTGTIIDKRTGKPIDAKIIIEDLETGLPIFTAASNATSGNFATVLQTGRDYGISISSPGYIFHSQRYTIPAHSTYTEFAEKFELDQLRQGSSFIVNNIFFDYDQAVLRPESRPELERAVALLKEYPTIRVTIDGHTDNIGSTSYNQKLSMQRAEAVRDYLITQGGIDSTRLEVRGFGFSKPVAPNQTDQGRQQNRRTEFTVLSM